MSLQASRTIVAGGTPYTAGYAIGLALGTRLAHNIDHYIRKIAGTGDALNTAKLIQGAVLWLEALPPRYREEVVGLAAGAQLPLQRVAEWLYVEECLDGGCSGFLLRHEGHVWVARNNDYCVTDLWGHITVHRVHGRLARMDFGLQGELFTSTGVNEADLWLHYNWLPCPVSSTKSTRPEAGALPSYVWLSEALETCRTLDELETLLGQTRRVGCMMLFAVEGTTEQAAIYECTTTAYRKRPLSDLPLAGTNHFLTDLTAAPPTGSSARRLSRMQTLLDNQNSTTKDDLIGILADDDVEQRGTTSGTVYATVACPGLSRFWYTFGGYPAASVGMWQEVRVSWDRD